MSRASRASSAGTTHRSRRRRTSRPRRALRHSLRADFLQRTSSGAGHHRRRRASRAATAAGTEVHSETCAAGRRHIGRGREAVGAGGRATLRNWGM